MEKRLIQDLLKKGETYTVEFKRGSIDDNRLIEALACLANGSGGTVLVGVDNDGTVLGAPPRHGETTHPRRIEALVASRTDPALLTDCSVHQIDGRSVIVITVGAASQVVATTTGRYVRRAIDAQGQPQCLPMRPHEVMARAASVGAQDYSRVPIPALTFDDLSPAEFDRFHEVARTDGDQALLELSNEELVKALNLSSAAGNLTVGALLVFGSRQAISRYLPAYEVSFQELDGLEVRSYATSSAPLLRAFLELVDRVQARNPAEEIDLGLQRVALPRFADVTIRELIANALVHRDYATSHPTLVEMNQDALVVSNPGGLPEGITVSNLLRTPPRPRNPALADVFKRAGLVERTGRGINRAFAGQLALGRPAPDYSWSTPASVVARVRFGPADRELAGYLAEARRDGQRFSVEDLLTLHEVRIERRISTSRAAALFQMDTHEARSTLNRLADRGLLEARGHGKGRTYRLAVPLYRRLGIADQYVWARGFDILQQEEMVLTFAERHGSITRREAADLCQIEPRRASQLLRRMRDEGKLRMLGQKRTARYVTKV